jgi:putative copper export protein
MDTPHPAEAAADRRTSNTVTAVVGLAVLALALVFLFNTNVFTSDWYALFKWVHVTGAVLWVGGGLALTILALWAERKQDPAEMAMLARQAGFIG